MTRRRSAGNSAKEAPDSHDSTASEPEDVIDVVRVAPVVVTTTVCALAAVVGHVLLGFNFRYGWLPWQPIAGASLSLVAVASFGVAFL